MGALLRIGIPAPLMTSYLLTTQGRKSGRPRTVPVNIVVEGDTRWLVSPYGNVGWVHNVRADPNLTLRRGARRLRFSAVELEPEAAGPVLKKYHNQVLATVAYFKAKRSDPVEAFVREADRHPVFLLTPTE